MQLFRKEGQLVAPITKKKSFGVETSVILDVQTIFGASENRQTKINRKTLYTI